MSQASCSDSPENCLKLLISYLRWIRLLGEKNLSNNAPISSANVVMDASGNSHKNVATSLVKKNDNLSQFLLERYLRWFKLDTSQQSHLDLFRSSRGRQPNKTFIPSKGNIVLVMLKVAFPTSGGGLMTPTWLTCAAVAAVETSAINL